MVGPDRASSALPAPIVACLLPEYEDKHIWWLILQYLEQAGFQHTASAFSLELKLSRGVPDGACQRVSEVGGGI